MSKGQTIAAQGGASITPLQQMVSSCSGAIITSVFVTPLDVVKIRLQTQQKPLRVGSCFIYSNGLMDCLCVCSYCNNGNGAKAGSGVGNAVKASMKPWYQKPGHFNGTLDAFAKIVRMEGLPALWSGLPPTLIMAVPATVVYFTTYDQLKYRLGYLENDPKTQYLPILAGSLARVFAVTLISPLELIRTKMQSQQLSYSQLGAAVKFSVQQGGVLSLMKGLGPSLLRDVPFSALYWFSYEKVKSYQMRTTGSCQPSFLQTFAAGAISGSIASVLTTPFDVIKTHRQIELGEAEFQNTTSSNKRKRHSPFTALCRGYSQQSKGKVNTSTWSLIARLYQQNGLPALYAGLVPRVVKVAPACAVMISMYEYGKGFFRSYNEHHRN